jgi:peroxiredoxin
MPLLTTPAAAIGSPCPPFQLPAVDKKTYDRDMFRDAKVLVVMFICNHCPYVQAVEDRLIKLTHDLQPQHVAVIAICSNDPISYPDDSFVNLQKRALDKKYPFPYLHDITQNVARDFGAVCTPDFFVYDSHRKLAYRGRLDDSWKDPSRVQHQELKEAVLALLAEQHPSSQQHPSMGCSIKWTKD